MPTDGIVVCVGDRSSICKRLDVSCNLLTTLQPLVNNFEHFRALSHLCADNNLFSSLQVQIQLKMSMGDGGGVVLEVFTGSQL
jgi:hypothetical protein